VTPDMAFTTVDFSTWPTTERYFQLYIIEGVRTKIYGGLKILLKMREQISEQIHSRNQTCINTGRARMPVFKLSGLLSLTIYDFVHT